MQMKATQCLLVVGVVSISLSGCTKTNSTVATKRGAVAGSAAGAVVGGVIGHQSGRGLEGAAIGAGAGGLGGAVMGSARDEVQSGKKDQTPADTTPSD